MIFSSSFAIAQSDGVTGDKSHFQNGKSMPRRERPFTVEEVNSLMATDLHLDDKQLKKVKKLNKKYATLIEGEKPKGMPDGKSKGGPGGGKGFPGGMGGFPGGASGMGGGFPGGGAPGGMDGGFPGGGPGGAPQGFSGNSTTSEDIDAQQEKYDKKLKKILTDVQYAGYLKIRPKYYSQRRIHDFLFGGNTL